jgi:hypothetical protein
LCEIFQETFFYLGRIVYISSNQLINTMSSLKSITHEELKNRLRQGATRFYYRKTGGELRIALGTLDLSKVPSSGQPKGGKGPANATSYYDLEKGWWRSISESQEVWVD